eukprot:m.400651 g.400651  ORF g.400651 m.400651 type:complete len:60 (+) comp28390_c1_seq5:342-521(+)
MTWLPIRAPITESLDLNQAQFPPIQHACVCPSKYKPPHLQMYKIKTGTLAHSQSLSCCR